MIICAAIKFTFIDIEDKEQSIMICGYRHSDCFSIWYKFIIKQNCKKLIQNVQGFMDDKGNFLNRIDARNHFIECNQGTPKWNQLYSEDLY